MADKSSFSGCFGCFMWLLMLGFLIAAAVISIDSSASPTGILIIVGLAILFVILAFTQFLKGSFDWMKRLFK